MKKEKDRPASKFEEEYAEFTGVKREEPRQHKQYIHLRYTMGWMTLSIFRLGTRFSVRLEIARGWNN